MLRQGAPANASLISPEKKKDLFSGQVVMEEKMDGRLRVHKSGYFLLISEDLQVRRATEYSLPGRYAVLDVFDKRNEKFLNFGDRAMLMMDFLKNPRHLPLDYRNNGVFVVPVIAAGKFSEEGILNVSFPESEHAKDRAPAGIVLKKARETKIEEYVSAQLVSPDFYQKRGDQRVVGFNLIIPPAWFIREIMPL